LKTPKTVLGRGRKKECQPGVPLWSEGSLMRFKGKKRGKDSAKAPIKKEITVRQRGEFGALKKENSGTKNRGRGEGVRAVPGERSVHQVSLGGKNWARGGRSRRRAKAPKALGKGVP